MNIELFTSICNGDIQSSILLSTKIILVEEAYNILDNVYIDICAYIGSFISLNDISKLIDIYSDTKNIISNDKIIIKDIYRLITKMCILCDIYNKHPRSKCGSMSLNILKNKIAHLFNKEDMKLSANGIMKFDGILPPVNSETYPIALRIIAIIIKAIKSTDDISIDYSHKLSDIADELRLSIDYITRTKHKFETKFHSNDNDNVWFLFGIFSLLYKEEYISNAYWLFNYEFMKKYRSKRLGLLWSIGIMAIYTHKKDISKGWNEKELNVIRKIDEISINLYNEIRAKCIKENPNLCKVKEVKEVKKNIDFILSYVPVIKLKQEQIVNHHSNEFSELKTISF
jgi:hypothetical protein